MAGIDTDWWAGFGEALLYGYDTGEPTPLESGRVAGSAGLSLSTGPAGIQSQNVSQSVPLYSADVAGGAPPPVYQNGGFYSPGGPPAVSASTPMAISSQVNPLLVVAAVALVVLILMK